MSKKQRRVRVLGSACTLIAAGAVLACTTSTSEEEPVGTTQLALFNGAPSPGILPALPDLPQLQPLEYPDADEACRYVDGNFDAAFDPQWVTTLNFEGPSDYHTLEGQVYASRPSHNDNFLNHHSYDFKFSVEPDGPYKYLLNRNHNAQRMEVEWETNYLPVNFRPTQGDRVSAIGYHIFDCPHGRKTEIHPPVLLAVHRPRPVHIPIDHTFDLNGDGLSQETVGSNVWVPGIVSDVWVNADAGEMMDGGHHALHEPAHCSIVNLPNRGPTTVCNDGPAIQGSSNIRRIYTYKIYLPQNPKHLPGARADAPEAPLYLKLSSLPEAAGSPAPTVQLMRDGDKAYLRVTVDLRNYSAKTWAHRIVAGWVYPDSRNWGIENFRLRVGSIKVHDDRDTVIKAEGDWRLWVNANMSTDSTANEWTNIMFCNDCADDDETIWPTDSEWRRNSTESDGTLFGSLWAFPEQPIHFQMHGAESDMQESGEDLGEWTEVLQHQPFLESTGRSRTDGKPGAFGFTYALTRGSARTTARLTAEAQALRNRYSFDPEPPPPEPAPTKPHDIAAVWNDGGLASFAVFPSTTTAFSPHTQWAVRDGGFGESIAWVTGDFDGDGDEDLLGVWNDGNANTLTVRRSMNGQFSHEHWAIRQGGWMNTTRWLAGDYNGDGKSDVAAVWNDAGQTTSIAVYLSNGNGFESHTQWAHRDGGWGPEIKWASGDFDGDGKTDILGVWQQNRHNVLTVRRSTGSRFEHAPPWSKYQGEWNNATQWLVGDFTGDGRADAAAILHQNGSVEVAVHQSGGWFFYPQRTWYRRRSWNRLSRFLVGDFNADHHADLAIVWKNGTENTISVLKSVNDNAFGMQTWLTHAGGWMDSTFWLSGKLR